VTSSRPENLAELNAWIGASPKLRSLEQAARKAGDGDSAHDIAHLLRVALWTTRLLEDEALREEGVAAALLHDLVNLPKDHPDRARASELSAEAARPLLRGAGFSPEAEERIALAIRQHSFSRGERPTGPLGRALQDADRLEALGAIGLLRLASTGARMGARYFHPEDPWARSRPLDDRAFSLDHFFTKLLGLPATMNTSAGREEALLRVRPLEAFLGSLERELGVSR